MKKKKEAKKTAFPALKQDIQAFLFEEEAAISKKDAVNLGLSLVILGSMLADSASAHSSYFENQPGGGRHVSDNSGSPPSPALANHTSYFSNDPTRGKHTSHSVHNQAPHNRGPGPSHDRGHNDDWGDHGSHNNLPHDRHFSNQHGNSVNLNPHDRHGQAHQVHNAHDRGAFHSNAHFSSGGGFHSAHSVHGNHGSHANWHRNW